jgi:hypothetical protein
MFGIFIPFQPWPVASRAAIPPSNTRVLRYLEFSERRVGVFAGVFTQFFTSQVVPSRMTERLDAQRSFMAMRPSDE